MISAAVGFRIHTGWAAAVALVGWNTPAVRVVDRRRLSLVEASSDDARFVFHRAAEREADTATEYVAAARDGARRSALREMERLVLDLRAAGFSIRAVGLPPEGRRRPTVLGDILRSHPLLHAAEAELFRDALTEACVSVGLRVVVVPSKDRDLQAARGTGLRLGEVKALIGELGRPLGPPWALDQKDAALAALVAAVGKDGG